MSVRSNVALLLSGALQKTPHECAALVLQRQRNAHTQGLKDWNATADGFLECAFTEEFVSSAAHEFCASARAFSVNDSREKLFFEKCVLLRAESVLSPPKETAKLLPSHLDDAADAMRRAAQGRRTEAEIARTAQILDARLDQIMPQKTRDDLYAGALFGVLSRMMQKEDER